MRALYLDCSPFVRSLISPELQALVPELEVIVGDPPEDEMVARADGAAVLLDGHTTMGAGFLARLRTVKSIVFLGSGPQSYIDMAAAARQGIAVRAIMNYGDRTIAEHAFALLLACARQVALMDRQLRQGIWRSAQGVELAGKTLGVVGTGGTGSALARMASGFGMRVIAWNRSGLPAGLPAKPRDLDALLAESDAVSIHVALTPQTERLIDARRLALMKPSAILVNVARGAVVDEAALVDALRSGRLAQAGLDVFAIEPLPKDHPLTTLDTVTLTSHAAFKTPDASARLIRMTLEQARRDLDALKAGKALA